MSNVLNYEQFVLTIQNDGDWYKKVTDTRVKWAAFMGHTTHRIDQVCREQKITQRTSRDRGYIIARLWDELGDSIPAQFESMTLVVERIKDTYVDEFIQGIHDHLKERYPTPALTDECINLMAQNRQIRDSATQLYKQATMLNLSQDYLGLVKRVEEFDKVAANYMLYEAPKLDSFKQSDKLASAFSWNSTPQKYEFWKDMYRKLDKAKFEVPLAPAMTAAPTQFEFTQPKETIMKTETITIKSITYLNNVDVTTLSADQLIDAISQCEQQIEDLGKIKAKSAAITAKVKRIKGVIAQLVKLLDGDTPAVAVAADKPE